MIGFAAEELELLAHLLEEERFDVSPVWWLAPRQHADEVPLSFAQQRLWFLDQLKPGSSVYNLPLAVRLKGKLDVAALEQTFSEIVRRHEALRTVFQTIEGKPLQVISPAQPVRLPLIDLREVAGAEQEQAARNLIQQETQAPFDLTIGPLLRLKLLHLSEAEHVLLLTMHHIISDGWSLGVLIQEVAQLYEAFSRGAASPLAELEIQYADYALWQRETLAGEVMDRELEYWRERLSGAPQLLLLPIDGPRPSVQTFNGAWQPLSLPAAVTEKLKALAQFEGATLFIALLAAFQVVLHCYTDQTDIVVGTDVANRDQLQTEGLIGFFVNQLVLRTDLSNNPTFRELLERSRTAALSAYAHQNVPFEKLVEALNPERNLKYSPLFQVKIVFQNAPMSELRLPGLTLSPVDIGVASAKFDLTPLMWESSEGLGGVIEYNTDLFNAATVARMARHFERIVTAVVAEPGLRLIELKEAFVAAEREARIMEMREREESNRNRFKRIKPKAISLVEEDLVEMSFLQPGEMLPLVLQPRDSSVDLIDWASSNRQTIEDRLSQHGAILFRNFHITSPIELEQFARSLCPDLFNENGEHPRSNISGSVYTPVFYPPDKQLLWHNENSFNHHWPTKIWFCCAQPAQRGGETPIVDSRKVYQLLDAGIKEKFLRKKIMYVRNYQAGLGLDWQTVFQTGEPAKVEEHCRKALMSCEWKDGNQLRTRCVRPAVVKHPKTGELVWFNQAQHWHTSCLDAGTRESLLSLHRQEDLPRNCYYGDGSSIEDSVMQEILAVYKRLEMTFSWKEADVLMIDNLLTAHGRNAFVGERKLLVAMGGMSSYADVDEAEWNLTP